MQEVNCSPRESPETGDNSLTRAKLLGSAILKRSSVRRLAFFLLRLSLGIAMLIWLQKSGALNFSSLGRIFQVWPLTLVAVGVVLLDVFLMSVRVSLLFRVQGLSLCIRNAFQLTMVGFLFSMFLPGSAGGEVARFYYAGRENHGSRPEIAAALLFDRLMGVLSLVLLPLLFAPFFLPMVRAIAGIRHIFWLDLLLTALLLALMIGAVTLDSLWYQFSLRLKRWPDLQNLSDRVIQAIAYYRKGRATLLYAMLLSLFANFALIIVTALGLYTTNPGSFSLKLLFVAPISHLVKALPLTPGGLGVGEAAFNALFGVAGIKGGAEALLCVRLWNAIVGLFGLAIYLWGVGRVVHRDEKKTLPGRDVPSAMEAACEPQFDRG